MEPALHTNTRAKANAWSLYALVVAAYATVFWFWQVEHVPTLLYIAGVLIWALALVPLAIWYRWGTNRLPMFELICVAYGVAYSPPIYLLEQQIEIMGRRVPLALDTMLNAAGLTIIGLISLISAYYFGESFVKRLSRPRIDLPLKPYAARTFIIFALGLGLLGKALVGTTETRYGALVNFLARQFEIGLVLLAYRTFSDGPMRSSRGRLYFLVAVGSLLGLRGGLLETALVPLVLVVITRWHAQRRCPVGLVSVAAGFVVVLTPIKLEFRARTWNGASEEGTIGLLKLWWESGQYVLEGQRRGLEEHRPLTDLMSRVDLFHKLAYVHLLSPDVVPYFDGRSYEYFLYTFVPRVVWPTKPIASAATDLMDFSYGLRTEDNTTTNFGIGQIAEAYANFAWIGVLFVMVIQGAFFALIDKVLNGRQSEGGRAIYLSIMVLFLNGIGTSAVVVFGSIIQLTIASALLMRPFAVSFSVRNTSLTGSGAGQRRRGELRNEVPGAVGVGYVGVTIPASERT